MCDTSATCGDCEDCQATDTFVNLRPVFREPTPPETTTMPPMRGDGGEPSHD